MQSIVDCKVEFPRERVVTDEVKELLSKILQAKPEDRPELFHIMTHPWFDLDEDDIEERHEEIRKRMEEEDAVDKEKEEEKKEEELKLNFRKLEKGKSHPEGVAHFHGHHDTLGAKEHHLKPKGVSHKGGKSPSRAKNSKAARSEKKNA